jgi:nucleotide-binding universal stress UspA family protein
MPRQASAPAPARRPGRRPSRRRTILCAVAGVEEAERPVAVARELAERLADEVVLVHVVVPPPPVPRGGGFPPGPYEPVELTSFERTGGAILRAIAERTALEAARRRPLVGDPATAVVSLAEEMDADLIVVGARRRGLFVSALLGSVSREIADATDRPVVVVPSAGRLAHLTPVRCVVCGVDGGPESRRAVRVANDLAARLQVGLVLAYAEATPALRGVPPLPLDEISEFLRDVVASEGLPAETQLRSRYGSAADVLEDVAEEEGAGLIVVGRRGGLLKDMFRGSVSAGLHAHAHRVVVLA